MSLVALKKIIRSNADSERAVHAQRFFKTGKGEYGEGDSFLGLTVPQSRTIAKQFNNLPLADVVDLLRSKEHEERQIALFILNHQYKTGSKTVKDKIYQAYLANSQFINNWDLVDSSAEYIVGAYIYAQSENAFINGKTKLPLKDRIALLIELAHSQNLWERRIAILSTFTFIKNGSYEETFCIAEILLHDQEDLLQKAVGWLLREVGKRISEEIEESFLQKHYKTMPRTMLRYAIERFSEEKRKAYLFGTI